jgi:FkbH-like protein
MNSQRIHCLCVSDFNLENFAGYLGNAGDQPSVEVTLAPFGQVMQVLMDEHAECWQLHHDAVFVWTQPQGVLPAFARLLDYESVSCDDLLADVDAFTCALLGVRDRVDHVFVSTWALPSIYRQFPLLNMRQPEGIAQALLQLNVRLTNQLASAGNIHVIDAHPWIESAGKAAFSPKLWHMAKIPYSKDVFQEAVVDLKSSFRALTGAAKKLVVLDLDDTLWGGVVGERSWENLVLGGHDPIGEAFVEFQKALRALRRRGIILAIVSKNEESVALEAMRRHPEMVLRPEQFAAWRINWNDKAQNVAELAAQLSLGLQSVVVIDDHPAERARVREVLPEVFVPEWPKDPMLYTRALLGLTCFNTPAITGEDLARAQMYTEERERTEDLKHRVGSVDEWLYSLKLKVRFEPLSSANLVRATQLFNKTNQMNLSTRRLSETELTAWAARDDHQIWTVHVSDRFGDSGLTGIISLQSEGQRARIVDFILSCRVMGRKVEETLLGVAIEHARSRGVSEVYAEFLPTTKNKPCLNFLLRSGMKADRAKVIFKWDAKAAYPVPKQVAVEVAPEAVPAHDRGHEPRA